MQLISWLMLGRSISQTSSRQTLWVPWAMNQDLRLPHSTFYCLPSLLPLTSLTPSSVLLYFHVRTCRNHFFDNTRSFRSQQLLLFNATLNPNSTSDYFFFFFCPTAGLAISCLWFTDGTLMDKENHTADKEWTFRSTGWLCRGKFFNVKQNHLQ